MSKFKTITINQLKKILDKQVEAGNGRLPVCVNKETFKSNLESDGCCILEVCGLRVERIAMLDGDGFTKTTKAGLEVDRKTAVLFGGGGVGFYGVISAVEVERYIRELKWGGCASERDKAAAAANIRAYAAELRRMTG